MPTVHLPASGYVAPVPNSGWQWLAWSDNVKLKVLLDAMFIIGTRIKGYKPCNAAFKKLPGGRSFDDIWGDASIYISYDPGNTKGRYGATLGKAVTISAYSIGMGRWTTAATLVHELAHVDGAPGNDTQAEDTLLSCLLSGLHDNTIIGMGPTPAGDPNRFA